MLKSTILVAVADIKGGVGKRQPCSSPDASPGAENTSRFWTPTTPVARRSGTNTYESEDDRRRKEDEANGTPHKPYKLGFDDPNQ